MNSFQGVMICTLILAGITIPSAISAQEARENKLSNKFSHAALAALADIHRWKEKARNDAKGLEPSPTFGKLLKIQARESLSQARLTEQTDGDRRAGEVLESLYAKMTTWTDGLTQARARLDATHAMNPDAVDKDEDLISISECEKSMHAVLVQGTFREVACH